MITAGPSVVKTNTGLSKKEKRMIVNSISELIGNTPLLRIDPEITGLKNIELYAKLETQNPFGSVKDRVGKSLLEEVLDDAKEKNMTIVEASSGNTAKALVALCGIEGLDFKTVTNRIKQPEVRMVLQLMGADIEELPGLSDCPDPNDPNDFTTVAANLARSEPDKYHYTDQYFNERNLMAHYETTGKEILGDLESVQFYFGFLGTCGSSMGVAQYLRDQGQNPEVWGVVASEGHHVPGGRNVNELWEVGFYRQDFFNGLIDGTSVQAVEGMLELNRRSGLLCGPTAGLSYYAALKKLKEVDADYADRDEKAKAVFIACDRVEPYTSYIKKLKPDVFQSTGGARPTVESQDEAAIAQTKQIEPAELEQILSDPKALIIDVRGNFAYATGHIPGSINILDELFGQMIEQGESFPKDRNIVIVCSIGTISRKFAAFLNQQGYQAASLKNGLKAWKRAGLPIEKTLQLSESVSKEAA